MSAAARTARIFHDASPGGWLGGRPERGFAGSARRSPRRDGRQRADMAAQAEPGGQLAPQDPALPRGRRPMVAGLVAHRAELGDIRGGPGPNLLLEAAFETEQRRP